MTKSIDARVARLEAKVARLEGGRSGRKALPILVTEENVCGIDPDSDSTTCPHASIYRHQKGCRGVACCEKTSAYYKEYRSKEGRHVVTKKKAGVEHLLEIEADALVTVTMDADVFRWLKEIVRAKHEAQRYTGWIPWYQDMVDRAHESFVAAEDGPPPEVVPEVVPNGATAKRVIHRRVAKKR